ncbi:Aste57867_7322 [Aphanomyces stellatus]|uniref:Aste57867_7322 protein n=1 Tax=Aphanomyces stellatus TaxID=120398 RepID=A0A485KI51_9STRA|nr:hypothetical protein As57867_007296 [Aphanomyces stellatus]VFT84241.1 Aste57867_7322 [Aphanomyces stellatus]
MKSFDLSDSVEDMSATKKTRGSKSPATSAKGTPKKSPAKAAVATNGKSNGAKKVSKNSSTSSLPTGRAKRSRVPTNFYHAQSAAELLEARHQKEETVDLASDDEDDEDDAADEDHEQEKEGDDEDEEEQDEDDEDDDDDVVEVIEGPASKRQRTSARTSGFRVTEPARQPAKKEAPKKKEVPAKKAAAPAPAKSSPIPAKKVVVPKLKDKVAAPAAKPAAPAKKESTSSVKPPAPTKKAVAPLTASLNGAATSAAVRRPAPGLSDAALNANTKQSKILTSQIKELTNAINSGMMLVSTLWEQYQEIMQKDIELREATLKVMEAAQAAADQQEEDEEEQIEAPAAASRNGLKALAVADEGVLEEDNDATADEDGEIAAATKGAEEEEKEDANPVLL